MIQINGAAGSGKGELLDKVAVNHLATKVIARALVSGEGQSDELCSQINPSASSSFIVTRKGFERHKMAYSSFDKFISEIKSHLISEVNAASFLLSDMFCNVRNGTIITSELTFKNDPEAVYVLCPDGEGHAVIGQIVMNDERVVIQNAWFECTCLSEGYKTPGVTTLIYEGVALFPQSYTYDRNRQADVEISSEMANIVVELERKWRSEVKKLKLSKQMASLRKTAVNLDPDELNQLPSQLRDIVAEYLSLSVDATSTSEFTQAVQTSKKPQSSATSLPCRSLNGDKIVITADPYCVPFKLIRGPLFIDSMLPLVFAPGAAVSKGISSRALMVCSLTTFDENFVTFPEQSFLGDDNHLWLPFLTGEFSHSGVGNRFKPPFRFTTRLTYRAINHLLFDQTTINGHEVSVCQPGLTYNIVYFSVDGVIVAKATRDDCLASGIIKVSQSSAGTSLEWCDFTNVENISQISKYLEDSNE